MFIYTSSIFLCYKIKMWHGSHISLTLEEAETTRTMEKVCGHQVCNWIMMYRDDLRSVLESKTELFQSGGFEDKKCIRVWIQNSESLNSDVKTKQFVWLENFNKSVTKPNIDIFIHCLVYMNWYLSLLLIFNPFYLFDETCYLYYH